jgi:hypothetical protein
MKMRRVKTVLVLWVEVEMKVKLEEEEIQRYQQHLNIHHYCYFHLQRIFCFEKILMQANNEVERD